MMLLFCVSGNLKVRTENFKVGGGGGQRKWGGLLPPFIAALELFAPSGIGYDCLRGTSPVSKSN